MEMLSWFVKARLDKGSKDLELNDSQDIGYTAYPEPRGPRFLPMGELVLWYGMFAPWGRLSGTTGFARGAP